MDSQNASLVEAGAHPAVTFRGFLRLWGWNLGAHSTLWFLCLGLSILYLFTTADAWYGMARRGYLGTFVWIQVGMIWRYLAVATILALWSWPLLVFWHRWRPSERWVSRQAVVAAWFWLTMFSTSFVFSFESWYVAVNFIREAASVPITYRTVSFLVVPAAVNGIVFLGTAAFAVAWGASALPRLWRSCSGRARGWIVGSAAAFVLLAAVGALAKPAASPEPSSPGRGPHIVMIGSDSLRADRLGAYGSTRDTSPAIDAIAREGVVCDRVYTVAPSTLESLLALLYGRSPRALGIRSIFPTRLQVEALATVPSLATVLGRAGYRTVAAGDWAASDLDRISAGFQVRDVEPALRFTDYLDMAANGCHAFLLAFLTTPLTGWAAPGLSGMLATPHTPVTVLSRAENEIAAAARSGRPLFLFLFLSTTHLPYRVPDGEAPAFGDPEYSGRHHRQIDFSVGELVHGDIGRSLQAESRRVLDLYDSCVRAFDGQVGRVASALRRHGIDRDTILVVFSDHGDDHWDPGTTLSRTIHAGDQSIRLPLILRWPRGLPPRRVGHLLRATDVPWTLAALTGTSSALDDRFAIRPDARGESFLPILEGREMPDDRVAFVESGVKWAAPATYPAEGRHLTYPPITELVVPDREWETRLVLPSAMLQKAARAEDRALVRGRRKLVYRPLKSGPEIRMYDLATDPDCRLAMVPDPELLGLLKREIVADPPECYLAWDRETFEAGFR